LAKVDLLDAASRGDIIEFCLDHLEKEPDVKDQPVLASGLPQA
jgi:hypothetical protein